MLRREGGEVIRLSLLHLVVVRMGQTAKCFTLLRQLLSSNLRTTAHSIARVLRFVASVTVLRRLRNKFRGWGQIVMQIAKHESTE